MLVRKRGKAASKARAGQSPIDLLAHGGGGHLVFAYEAPQHDPLSSVRSSTALQSRSIDGKNRLTVLPTRSIAKQLSIEHRQLPLADLALLRSTELERRKRFLTLLARPHHHPRPSRMLHGYHSFFFFGSETGQAGSRQRHGSAQM